MARRNKKSKTNYNALSTIIFVVVAVIIIVTIYFLWPLIVKDKTADVKNNNSTQKEVVSTLAGDGTLSIHFISVGQADSIFIQFPTGNNMLIDASEKSTAKTVTTYISNLGVTTIDYVLLTHQDSDHVGGMVDVFNTFEVKNALRPSVYSTYSGYDLPETFNIGTTSGSTPSSTKTYYNYLESVYNEGCKWEAFNKDSDMTFVSKGQSDDVTYTCTLDFLTPTADVGSIKYKSANNFSPIMILKYGDFSIMFTGDAEKEVEQELLNYYIDSDLDVDVLKVGHHGSKTSSTKDFINKVKPETAIISCGLNPEKNKFCPWQVTLDTLNEYGSTIYRTDLQGNIVLTVSSAGVSNIVTDKTCNDYNQILSGYSAE